MTPIPNCERERTYPVEKLFVFWKILFFLATRLKYSPNKTPPIPVPINSNNTGIKKTNPGFSNFFGVLPKKKASRAIKKAIKTFNISIISNRRKEFSIYRSNGLFFLFLWRSIFSTLTGNRINSLISKRNNTKQSIRVIDSREIASSEPLVEEAVLYALFPPVTLGTVIFVFL